MAGGKNPWEVYQQQAAAGTIDIGESAAKQAAEFVADTLTMMRIAKTAIDDRILNFKGFGNLPSGDGLAQRFYAAARDLDDRLAEDEKILRGMGELFTIAGKVYENTDVDAAARFERLRNDRFGNWENTAWDFPGVPLANEGRLPGWARNLTVNHSNPDNVEHPEAAPEGGRLPTPDLQGAKGGESIPVSLIQKPQDDAKKGAPWSESAPVENAYAIEYNTYRNLGAAIGAHNQEILDAAAVWNWIGDRLHTAFTDLATRLQTLRTSGAWEGDGPKASENAVKTYEQNVIALRDVVTSIGNNLEWTSGWLWTVKLHMPWEAQSWGGSIDGTSSVGYIHARDVELPLARKGFNNFYVPGVQTASTGIPPIPAPAQELVTTAAAGPGPGPGNQSTPGPGPLANPGPGPGPGRQVPGPGPGKNNDALQRELARRQLEAQRRADQAAESQRKANEKFQQEQRELARKAATEQLANQREREAAARRQQQQQAMTQAASAGQDALQKAMSAGQEAAQQAMSAAQQAAQQAAAGLQSGLGGLPSSLEAARAAAAKALGAGPGGGAGGGLGSPSVARALGEASKLFPRANMATGAASGLAAAARAGASPMGMPGSPGAAGAAGRPGGNEGGQNHKRPSYLESAEHLDEALGDAPRVVKPVVER
ncbi:hypothetical protein AB0H49_01310 [Nocardia sp. NPDC050713]|uniref:hypothetical protein n=1 Tax=Nocardia sp. NPDC050713 TaxID=3154511 RepID=UPI0033DC4245